MKKQFKVILTLGIMACSINPANAQLKKKLQEKLDAAQEKLNSAGNKYKTYDFSDESGISGSYFVNEQIVQKENTLGFRYTKEKEGEIVNELYVELGGDGYGSRPNSMTFELSEKFKSKYDFNYFEVRSKDCIHLANNHNSFVFMEVAEMVYAYAEEDKVLSVAAKDSADFADYDTETVQVLFDQKMALINSAAMEKETAKWMKNEVYKKNVGKIVFATEDYHLMKRGYGNKPPMVEGDDFKTVLDMSGNMQFMSLFEFPPSKKYPGQELNIEYEMNGVKTSRTELRALSSAWGKMIPRLQSSDFAYRQHEPKALRTYNSYYGRYVQDYAFVNLLYLNKDKFMIGQEYDLTVKMYSSRDGENGELIVEGNVKLKYTAEAHEAFTKQEGVWDQFEDFLDE